ncbi:MAG: type VI secretion system lipoprotein TssJ [Rhodocyclaceae bacterium]
MTNRFQTLLHIARVAVPLALIALTGCGAVQTVREATVSTTRAIFLTQTLRLKLDLIAREGINGDDKERSMSVVVRVYQLKDPQTLDAATYEQVLADDAALLKDSLIASKALVLRPGATVSLDEPLDKATQAVAVVAFFRKESRDDPWKVVIPRGDLSDDKPFKVSIVGFAVRRETPVKG